MKIGLDRLGDKPLWAVRVAMEFIAGESDLESKLVELSDRVAPAAKIGGVPSN